MPVATWRTWRTRIGQGGVGGLGPLLSVSWPPLPCCGPWASPPLAFFYSFEEEVSGSNFSSLRFSLLFFQMVPRVLSLELAFGLHVSCRLKYGGGVGGGMCLPYFPGLGGWEFD